MQIRSNKKFVIPVQQQDMKKKMKKLCTKMMIVQKSFYQLSLTKKNLVH